MHHSQRKDLGFLLVIFDSITTLSMLCLMISLASSVELYADML